MVRARVECSMLYFFLSADTLSLETRAVIWGCCGGGGSSTEREEKEAAAEVGGILAGPGLCGRHHTPGGE